MKALLYAENVNIKSVFKLCVIFWFVARNDRNFALFEFAFLPEKKKRCMRLECKIYRFHTFFNCTYKFSPMHSDIADAEEELGRY